MDVEMEPFLTSESVISKGNRNDDVQCTVDILETPWEEREEAEVPYSKRVFEHRSSCSKSEEKCHVDLMEHFDKVFQKKTFDSFKEFDELFSRFKRETGSVFRIKSSCSVTYENSRRKQHFIPSRFKFVSVKYCCVHYGQPKVSGQGIRTKQRYLPCGCGSVLSVAYNRGALFISQVNMKHNHEVNSKIAPYYAINRRLTNHELRQVADVIAVMPSSRALQFFLKERFHRPMTLQDAKNTRARLKSLQMKHVPNEHLSNVSNMKVIHTNFSDIEDGTARDIKQEDTEESKLLDDEQEHCFRPEEAKHEMDQEDNCLSETKSKSVSEIIDKFADLMNSCDTAVFWERISVMKKVLDCWENGENLAVHYISDCTRDNLNLGFVKKERSSVQEKSLFRPLHQNDRISYMTRSEAKPNCIGKAGEAVFDRHVRGTLPFLSGSPHSDQVSASRCMKLIFPHVENKPDIINSSIEVPKKQDNLYPLVNHQETLDNRTTNQSRAVLSDVNNVKDHNCHVFTAGIGDESEGLPYIACIAKEPYMDIVDQANEVEIEINDDDFL